MFGHPLPPCELGAVAEQMATTAPGEERQSPARRAGQCLRNGDRAPPYRQPARARITSPSRASAVVSLQRAYAGASLVGPAPNDAAASLVRWLRPS